MDTKTKRICFNLSPEIAKVLSDMAKRRNTTMTEILRQAIGTEKFINEARSANNKILIEDAQGRLKELVFRF